MIIAVSSTDTGASPAPVIISFLVIGILYLVPTIIAVIRNPPNTGSVLVVNIFLGWTFIGWVIALAMAVRSRREQQPQSVIPPVWQPPPGPQAPPVWPSPPGSKPPPDS